MSDSTIITANGFPDPESLALVSDVQFREPYSSAAINRKLRGLALPGIYSGFTPSPGSGLNLLISSGDDSGTCSFNVGTSYQISAHQQADVTLAMTAGTSVLVALQVTYALGTETDQVNSASTVKAVEFVLLDTTATLAENQLEMCKVTIPADATQITSDMIDLSGRVARSLTFELSSAIDSSDEETAANSLAVKNAVLHIESEIAEAISTKSLTVSGAVALLSTLAVTGAATFGGDVTASGNVMADRMRGASGIDIGYQSTTANTRQLNFYSGSDSTLTAYINAVGSTLASSYLSLRGGNISLIGSTSVTGALSVSSALTVSGSAAVTGTFAVGSNLYVTGQALFSSSVITPNGLDAGYSNTTAGNRQISFYSNGTTTITAAIGVTGTSTSTTDMVLTSGKVSVTGALVAMGTATISGAAYLSSSLTVTGNGVFNSDMYVTGALYSAGAMRAAQYIDLGQQNATAGGRQLSFYSTPGVVTAYIAANGTAASTSSMTLSAGVVAITTSATVSGALSISSSLTVSGSAAISGSLSVSGGITTPGEFRSTDANNYRIVAGNYGFFTRFDGTNCYFMFTASGDQYGGYNDLRPLSFNASTGSATFGTGGVSMGAGLYVAGSVTVGGGATFNSSITAAGRIQGNSDIVSASVVYSGNGASYLASDANIYGSCWGGYLNNWIISKIGTTAVTSIRLGSASDVTNGSGSLADTSGYVVTMGGDFGSSDGSYRIRPLQYYINGTWYTAASA